ncbi:MAG: GNAT family acetyltransferase [Bacteroidetes bacterium]|nr:MAG: GNAT family acetyltransferase [Bacteroidota bacterium]
MGFTELSTSNLATEHICCAIAEKKEESGLALKKDWLNERIREGLIFRKLDQRGKVFIEYLPAEKAWAPVFAPHYLYINCFWVSGSFKGKGYGKDLIGSCIADAKHTSGIVALSSAKKRPFLSDGKFLKKAGFTVCDEANPYFELLVYKTDPSAPDPRFADHVRNPVVNFGPGLDLFYTSQCPFAPDYAVMAANHVHEKGLTIRIHHLDTREKAVQHSSAWSTYSVFKDGIFQTHEIQTAAKLLALATQ